MSKVGIITYHNGSNYGAALQAFALQEALKEFCDDVKIINYDNRFISKGLDRFRFDMSLRGIYYLLSDIVNLKNNTEKINRFHDFFARYYVLSDLMSKDQLNSTGLPLDVGISGSDQIWNPLLNKGVDDIYYLNIPGIKKKCSYASSVGSYKFDNEIYNKQIINLLSTYTSISVRENSELIAKSINKEVRNVCDPTLLLTKDQWGRKLDLSLSRNKYLLIYAMTDFQNITEYAIQIAQKKRLHIKYIGMPVKKFKNVKYITNAGPKEFVDLFFNAEYVVTNSFHGTAFSVNFGKQFISLKNPKNPERATYFLNSINAKNRLVDDYKFFPEDMSSAEIYSIHHILSDIVADSMDYLKTLV